MEIACNLNAIATADRPRYRELMDRLRSAVRGHREISDGLEIQIDGDLFSMAEIGEWIGMERLCCPFLTLQATTTGSNPHALLMVTGPEGVMPILEAEFLPR